MNWNDSYTAAVSIYFGLNIITLVGVSVLVAKVVVASKRMEEQIEAIFEELDE
jgi:hypothetical protein